MSDKLLEAIRKREQAKLHPEPVKPKKAAKKAAPEPTGLGTVTTDDIPHG